jgi:uncharacterized protein (DUF1330 family)
MAKGYWIVRIDVTDPEKYQAYLEANTVPLKKFSARLLVQGGRYETIEGSSRPRNVVVEFPSYEAALECCRSPEYLEAAKVRVGAATMDLVVVEGHDGPQL